MHEPPYEDWVEVRLVLGGEETGLRIVTAVFDADDQPGSVCDVVTIPGGQRQETVSGTIAGSKIRGTYRTTDGDQKTPRPLTEREEQALCELAAALRRRYP